MVHPIPGVVYSVSLFVTSEKGSIDTCITLDSVFPLPIVATPDLRVVLAQFACEDCLPFAEFDDWRLMTDAEILRFKEARGA